MPLFRRTTHGVTLTEAGRLLSNQAEGLLEKCDRALSLMRERNMPVQGSVRIACELEISYAAQIREFTARFSERYPDIELVFDVIAENTPPSLCTRYDLVFTPANMPNCQRASCGGSYTVTAPMPSCRRATRL